ncbi:MAG: thermonuclease family protein [Ancalomicrobiaceae bacterium]|nr:thermonuclease family protein [Ancalomicrobiaceae bacterium]
MATAAAEPIDPCAFADGRREAGEQVEATTIISGDTLGLRDGRIVRLAGISVPRLHVEPAAGDEPEPTDFAAIARTSLAGLVAGRTLTLRPIAASPDRHGRIRARLTRAGDGLWIEAELVARGLARVEPGTDDYVCARHLEAIEADARAAQRGVWGDRRFRVLSATDPDLGRWIGRYVLIEGKVVSTGQSGSRHYLNFGTDFRRDFAIELNDKVNAEGRRDRKHPGRFATEGFMVDDIVGRTLRVRGVLAFGGGGLIRPSVPEEIEWLSTKP